MAAKRVADEVDVRLELRIRARRNLIGMSQERLAELTGVTFQQVQKYERGVNRIAASRLCQIARALDAPVQMFFEGVIAEGRSSAQDDMVSVLGAPEGAQLLKAFLAIPTKSLRRKVVDIVSALGGED